MKELYNLMWVYPMLAKKETVNVSRVCDIQKNNTQALVSVIGVDAVILYPALLTPAVVVGKSDLEILLLIKDGQDLDESNVNQQLKISPGLDAMKPYLKDPLFKEAYFLKIKIENLQFNDNVIKGKGFSGILDKRAIEFYKKEKYNQLKLVTIDTGELFGFSRGGKQENLNKINQKSNQKEIVPGEKQDELLWKRLKKINGEGLPLHSFKINNSKDDNIPDVDLTDVNWKCPIQSYHPVIFDERIDCYLNMACIADIHLSARQSVLKNSTARVIDCPKNPSKEIGALMNHHTRNFINILNNTNTTDRTTDAVILAGDLVDLVSDVYLPNKVEGLQKIWEAVEVEDKNKNYKNFVNYILFYSILVDFYQKNSSHPISVFGVVGNHDPYSKPWGISPRAGLGIKKANPGIPADHNLTFYEATLAFGPTFDENPGLGNLDPNNLIWYHLVFSPLSDFKVCFPNQILVGLAWGDSEDIIQGDEDVEQGWFGHLPRADKAVSDSQVALIEDAVKESKKNNKKVILASHFTLVSYDDHVPAYTNAKPTVGKIQFKMIPSYSLAPSIFTYSQYHMGTIENRNDVIFEKYLFGEKPIQCVLTGHSHRGMLYKLLSHDDHFVSTVGYEIDKYDHSEPIIIVTDSAGPLPRVNHSGEFEGWGSNYASGTFVGWDKSTGNIDKIERIESTLATSKPRIAVAIDYYDIMRKDAIHTFRSKVFVNKDLFYGILDSLPYDIVLNENLVKWGVRIKRISLSLLSGSKWNTIEVIPNQDTGILSLSKDDGRLLYNSLIKHQISKVYVSFFFDKSEAPHLSSYSYEHGWNIEAELSIEKVTTMHSYLVLKRSTKFKEKPDFDSR